MGDFRMPSLGADMKQGTLVCWLVKVGDRVEHGQIIAEIETDKGLFEIEVFESGIVGEILIEERQKVPVGTVLARISGEEATTTEPTSVPPPCRTRMDSCRPLSTDTCRGVGNRSIDSHRQRSARNHQSR